MFCICFYLWGVLNHLYNQKSVLSYLGLASNLVKPAHCINNMYKRVTAVRNSFSVLSVESNVAKKTGSLSDGTSEPVHMQKQVMWTLYVMLQITMSPLSVQVTCIFIAVALQFKCITNSSKLFKALSTEHPLDGLLYCPNELCY